MNKRVPHACRVVSSPWPGIFGTDIDSARVSTPSLSELAAIVGLSRYQLPRRFERVYGMAPFEWQRQVRVERARALIGTGRSLAEVAVDCGVADQSHRPRAFVSHFGFTPGACTAALRTSRA